MLCMDICPQNSLWALELATVIYPHRLHIYIHTWIQTDEVFCSRVWMRELFHWPRKKFGLSYWPFYF